jgi:hypothetical protein
MYPRYRQLSRRSILAVTLGSLLVATTPVAPVQAATPVDVVFNSTGAEQTWVVPDDVTSIHVVLIGGRGGDATSTGFAHVVSGDLAVAEGTTLYVEVAGNGANSIGLPGAAGGFNGGGAGGTGSLNAGAGGGGASDIRTVARAATGSLESRLMVAAGGGGGGGDLGIFGGAGGNAAASGESGTPGPGPAGTGGTQAFVGFGGNGGFGSSGALNGTSGAFGVGGAGGNSTVQNGNGGGGGGGGYYGGGGGGGGAGAGGGGGGGGSSFVGAAQNSSVSLSTAEQPTITITYQVAPDPTPDPPGDGTGTVDAVITMADSTVCIELSTSSVDFGTEQFGQVGVVATPEIVVMNCSDVWLRLYARGSNATGAGASWALLKNDATCADTLGLDNYHLGLHENQAVVDWRLGTTNTELEDIDAGSPGSFSATIDTACPGSSGAGQQMSMQITFTATEATP